MKETIRVEEEEDQQETDEWSKAINETRKKIKELEQAPPPSSERRPEQPAQ